MFDSKKKMLADFMDQVWGQGSLTACDAYIADTYIIHHDPGDPWDGQTLTLEGFKDRLVKSRAMAPDQKFIVQSMIEEEDRIAVAWKWQGTHLGDMPNIPSTGKAIHMSGLTIYDFTLCGEAWKLSGHWQVADRLSVYQQIMRA
jgi:steroid delta-isomerase-like uncharacterized protein